MTRFSILLAALALAACGAPAPKGAADGNAADPALTSALADPIMVDPQLGAQANTDTIRPPDMPMQAPVPAGNDGSIRKGAVTLGALAQQQAGADRSAAFKGCDLDVRYGLRWSMTLPAEIAVPDAAQVSEAAGSDTEACRLRVVSFTLDIDRDTAIAHYRKIAREGGYAVGESDEDDAKTVVARRAKDGAAFTATVAAAEAGGVAIDLMSNRGK